MKKKILLHLLHNLKTIHVRLIVSGRAFVVTAVNDQRQVLAHGPVQLDP